MNVIGAMMSLLASQEATHGAAEAGAGGVGELITHHLSDSREIELPFFLGTWHLPSFPKVQLGPLGLVDFSPTKHVVFLFLSALLLLAVFIPLGRAAARPRLEKAPKGFGNGMEAMILFFRDEVVRKNIGHGADAFAPYILTLFFFILAMNLWGLVPWGSSATGNISVTLGLALCTLILVEVSGMRALGVKGYLKTIFYVPHGMHPLAAVPMLLIMTPVEFAGKLTKPFALTIRLFANMMAGHTLVFALGGLVVTLGGAAVMGGATAMAIAVMVLEVFVAFLQAFIFAMLTSVFVGLIRHAH